MKLQKGKCKKESDIQNSIVKHWFLKRIYWWCLDKFYCQDGLAQMNFLLNLILDYAELQRIAKISGNWRECSGAETKAVLD